MPQLTRVLPPSQFPGFSASVHSREENAPFPWPTRLHAGQCAIVEAGQWQLLHCAYSIYS